VCAVGLQIAMEKITLALAAYQSSSVKTLVKEQRSFGFWSPRRCDVYVVSHQVGYLQDRVEIAAHLWQHNISADIMYESGPLDADHENHVEICAREGILCVPSLSLIQNELLRHRTGRFIVYPRPRTARRDQSAFKVKSVLKGTEYEGKCPGSSYHSTRFSYFLAVSRQELTGWLQQQILEQKKIDASTSGASVFSDAPQSAQPNKEGPFAPDLQLLLPVDVKKQRKQVKHIFLDRGAHAQLLEYDGSLEFRSSAFEASTQLTSAAQSGIPTIAIDVPSHVVDSLTQRSWLSDDDAWRNILSAISNQPYANLVKETILRKKAEGHRFVLLFAVREERLQVLTLG
jgi:eukaryotic translation initiation factor 2-alpha kinase 4